MAGDNDRLAHHGALPPAPAGPPRAGWGIPDAAVGFFAGLFGASVATGLWVGYAGTDRMTLGTLLAGLLGLWTGYVGTCLIVSRTKGTATFAGDFGLGWPRPVDAGLGAIAGLGSSLLMVPAIYFVLVQIHVLDRHALDRLSDPAEKLSELVSGSGIVVLALFVGLGAPVVEELFFRGLLQRALVRRLGPLAAIPITAVVFGAAHLQPLQFPALVAFGLVLGALAHTTGRLGPSMVAHVVFNGVTLVSLFLAR